MAKTLTLEGDVNAVDTLTRLTSQGSVTAPSLVVPAGMTKIERIMVALGARNTASGSITAFLRLGGNAVLNGEQQIVFGGVGGQAPAAGADHVPSLMEPFILRDTEIAIRPGDTIDVSAEIAGAGVGETTVIVTLIFGA